MRKETGEETRQNDSFSTAPFMIEDFELLEEEEHDDDGSEVAAPYRRRITSDIFCSIHRRRKERERERDLFTGVLSYKLNHTSPNERPMSHTTHSFSAATGGGEKRCIAAIEILVLLD